MHTGLLRTEQLLFASFHLLRSQESDPGCCDGGLILDPNQHQQQHQQQQRQQEEGWKTKKEEKSFLFLISLPSNLPKDPVQHTETECVSLVVSRAVSLFHKRKRTAATIPNNPLYSNTEDTRANQLIQPNTQHTQQTQRERERQAQG